MESYLQLKHINKQFGQFTALNEINLAINQGELVCFLGPSGCGKTTLLRIIAGLENNHRGQLFNKDSIFHIVTQPNVTMVLCFNLMRCSPI